MRGEGINALEKKKDPCYNRSVIWLSVLNKWGQWGVELSSYLHPTWPNRTVSEHGFFHTDNGILLIHEKEWNIAFCNDVDWTRVYYAKWNKSEKDK